MNEQLIFSSTDLVLSEQVCSLLKDNNIPFVKKVPGLGEYLTIVTGNSFNNPIQIYISDEDFEKAKELINEINNSNEETDIVDLPDELKDFSSEEEKECQEEYKKSKKYNSYLLRLIIFPIIIIITAMVVSNLLF